MANHPNRKKAVEVKVNYAEQNAAAWYSSIAELVAALSVDYDRLERLRDEIDSRFSEWRSFESDAETEGAHSAALDRRADFASYCVALVADEDNDAIEFTELTAAATIEGDLQKDADAVRDRIQEGPLSVEVRSGWYAPGSDSTPEEFSILLSTGGPALRLIGDLDEHGEPTRAYLQHQDWGTSWTDYYAGDGSGEVLLTYAQQFYFGE